MHTITRLCCLCNITTPTIEYKYTRNMLVWISLESLFFIQSRLNEIELTAQSFERLGLIYFGYLNNNLLPQTIERLVVSLFNGINILNS